MSTPQNLETSSRKSVTDFFSSPSVRFATRWPSISIVVHRCVVEKKLV